MQSNHKCFIKTASEYLGLAGKSRKNLSQYSLSFSLESKHLFPQIIVNVRILIKESPSAFVCLFTRLTLWKIFHDFVSLDRKKEEKLTRGFFDDAEPDERNSFDSPELLSMLVINAVAPRNLLRSARASTSSLLSPSSSTKNNILSTSVNILNIRDDDDELTMISVAHVANDFLNVRSSLLTVQE